MPRKPPRSRRNQAHASPQVAWQMQGASFEIATARLENREAVIRDIEKAQPTHVLNCAGITGRPNVDWCEDHKVRATPRASR